MDTQETLDAIKALLLDKEELQNAKRIECLERLSDRVHLYYMHIKHYESLVAPLDPLPEAWRSGEVGQAFRQAARTESDMFAIMRELDALKSEE